MGLRVRAEGLRERATGDRLHVALGGAPPPSPGARRRPSWSATRPSARCPGRREVSGRRDVHRVRRDAQRVGDDLAEHGPGALAHLGVGRQREDPAARRQLHAMRTLASRRLAAAGEPGPVPAEREPDPRRGARPRRRAGRPRRDPRQIRSKPDASAAASSTSSAADALAQHLAGGGDVALAVRVAPADLERATCPAPRRSGPGASPPRTRSAARRTRGTRRWAACWSAPPGRGSGRWGRRTGRRRGSPPRDRTTGDSVV